MIKTFYQEDIINRLAALFTYGLNEEYSYRAIEERIASSNFVNALENNEYSIESRIESIVESTYNVSLFDKQVDISFKGLFIAESYFKLFLYFNKSFEYIFLYWPLSTFIERYGVYHEMDFSNLRNDFESKVKETTLLRKLAQDRQIKLVELSKLSGISESTIKKYSIDDKYLFGASHENIYKLSIIFGVKENIFVPSLAIYLDKSVYLFDNRNKDYRNFLGLYYVSYFDNRIEETDFLYNRKNNCFESSSGLKLIVIADVIENLSISRINELSDSKTYVVIIPLGFLTDERDFIYLKDVNALDVFVLAQEFVYIAKKNYKKEITDTVNRALTIRAMEKISLL